MLLEAIDHRPEPPFAWPVELEELRVRIRVKKGERIQCRVVYGDRYDPGEDRAERSLERVAADERFDWYEGSIPLPTRRVRYVFRLEGEGSTLWYGEKGISPERRQAGVFQFPYIHEEEVLRVPDWARDAVVYQIFPERFAKGDPDRDPEGVLPWSADARPQPDSFYGGDLRGIIDRMPYLAELGVNLLYLTPVFTSPSNHKYDIDDYYRIDPHFGDVEICREMVETAHRHGIRVLFDAVFNHCGAGFFAFRDVREKGEASPYQDWFRIKDFPVVMEPEPNYETFANHIPRMPKLMTHRAEVRDYFLEVAQYWIREVGIDGWRLDVANEVDPEFWRAFRRRVKSACPEALIVGEIWHDAGPWLRGDRFDSVMNYPFREAVLSFFATGELDAEGFDARLSAARMAVPEPATFAMFNLLGSHDTERFLTLCQGDRRRLRLALLFQMTYLGIPMLYYGDEIGMEGGADPDCRRPMIWEEEKQDRELLAFVQRLTAIRREVAPLRRGDYRTWSADGEKGLYAYLRRHGGESVGVVLNNSHGWQEWVLDASAWEEGSILIDALTGNRFPVHKGVVTLSLEGMEGVILVEPS
ncbi:alpha-glycosidase [Kroppenstedtia eburnea]|uniref:Glycosidase n=1 Tax=Kroppenstedtia eburnea TaxID=714067 RepID=A0A1N7Q2L0_9BACL|nr:alpha-glycosidase [Kroppenstedtia eburnea]QKI82634.1 alpha-glycosidase [Kroppenstedtia eburnea]SIT17134.1 Glycosidase [Kroppenstedtia eburnea]